MTKSQTLGRMGSGKDLAEKPPLLGVSFFLGEIVIFSAV